MSQSQVWRKRSATPITDYPAETTTWMKPQNADRAMSEAVPAGQRKAGVKRRRY